MCLLVHKSSLIFSLSCGFLCSLESALSDKISELTASLEELTREMNSIQEALKKEEARKIVRKYSKTIFNSQKSGLNGHPTI